MPEVVELYLSADDLPFVSLLDVERLTDLLTLLFLSLLLFC